MTTIFAIILLVYHEAYHTEADQTVHRRLAQQYANARLLVADAPLTAENFHLGIRRLAELNPDVDIYLLDEGGEIIASSLPEGEGVRTRVGVGPLRKFMDTDATLPILGDDPRYQSGQEIFSVAPISIQDCPAKLLYVVLHRKGYEDAVRQLRRTYTINESLWLLVSCGLLAVIATLFIIRSITRRLSLLKVEMEHFQAVALDTGSASVIEPSNRASDEIAGLSAMFKTLAGRVRSQMETLRETDEARRTMVANISHDLRTPLTTLQAHLDTLLLKEDTLTPTERQKYLDIAASQSRRLTRLVDQLLELAKLDAGQVVLHREPFQLAELILDVAQKFALSAKNQNVTLHTDFSSSLPLVIGDIGLIDRVIYNLTENAIQHSPAGGTVTLRVRSGSPDHVELQIEDVGPGMTLAEQGKIFDRFYRGDPSRTAGAHAGLGLAIVKSILDLHGISLTVRSRPKEGSSFSFELPSQGTASQPK
jgi:signal transduction histidine kinase